MKPSMSTEEFSEKFSALDSDDQDMIVAYMDAIRDLHKGLLSAQAEASFREVRAANEEPAIIAWLHANNYLA